MVNITDLLHEELGDALYHADIVRVSGLIQFEARSHHKDIVVSDKQDVREAENTWAVNIIRKIAKGIKECGPTHRIQIRSTGKRGCFSSTVYLDTHGKLHEKGKSNTIVDICSCHDVDHWGKVHK
jgi:hypothetical protein